MCSSVCPLLYWVSRANTGQKPLLSWILRYGWLECAERIWDEEREEMGRVKVGVSWMVLEMDLFTALHSFHIILWSLALYVLFWWWWCRKKDFVHFFCHLLFVARLYNYWHRKVSGTSFIFIISLSQYLFRFFCT